MAHAWYRRESLSSLESMTWRQIRLVGRWALDLEAAEEAHAKKMESLLG